MGDARKDRRTLLSLKIRYKSATLEDFIERYSMDISGGGVFIKAKKPLAVGTLLKFEFVLQDQSTLIHGVGRVVWRREQVEADESNPAGMGIKFIKMDPESRGIVQKIVDERARPGVFDRGKDGVSVEPQAASEPPAADPTRVSHVSEFLVSAFETGGAGETATREARAARARGASSAFGGGSSSAGIRSSAAPAMDPFEDDDFIDNETTKVQALPTSEFPNGNADATVVAAESPFAHERRQTPVVPASTPASAPASAPVSAAPVSPLEAAVPDLFGPDSFGPAPGEVIDASLLDPAVATVPPKASALPRGAMPDSPGVPHEAFRVPQAPAPVRSEPSAASKRESKSRVGLVVAIVVLLLAAAGGVAAWQFGLLDGVVPGVSTSVPVTKAPPVVDVAPKPVEPATGEASAEGSIADSESTTEAEAADTESPETTDAEAAAADDGIVKVRVTSVPKGAFVSINGKGAGRTPLEVEYEAGTKLSFFAKARGFLARRQQVVVDAENPNVRLVLPTLPYEVEVVSNPVGARASAVGGGEITTPGTMKFRSVPGSRKIVVSKDGYSTMSVSVKRSSFVEEKTRMFSTISVTLAKEDAAPEAAAPAANDQPSAAVEPAPEPAAPAPEEPASSEPSVDDAAE